MTTRTVLQPINLECLSMETIQVHAPARRLFVCPMAKWVCAIYDGGWLYRSTVTFLSLKNGRQTTYTCSTGDVVVTWHRTGSVFYAEVSKSFLRLHDEGYVESVSSVGENAMVLRSDFYKDGIATFAAKQIEEVVEDEKYSSVNKLSPRSVEDALPGSENDDEDSKAQDVQKTTETVLVSAPNANLGAEGGKESEKEKDVNQDPIIVIR